MTQQLPPVGPSPDDEDPATPDATPARPSLLRRSRIPLLVAAAVVVVGGAGAGIGIAATSDSSTSGTPQAATSSTPGEGRIATGAPGNGKRGGKNGGKKGNGAEARQRPTRATIVSESSSKWTVRTMRGQNVTVTITPQTKFGKQKAPAARSAFTVGKQVAIIGQRNGTQITANRVRMPRAMPGAGSPTPSPSSS